MPNMLSGGEQQRVTIARALANTPPLLLLDEPTGDLDTKNTRNVVRMLRHLNEDLGVTLLMVTHDVYLKNFASRILYMRDGKLLSTEKIPEQTRREAFRELDELVRSAERNFGTRDRLTVGQSMVCARMRRSTGRDCAREWRAARPVRDGVFAHGGARRGCLPHVLHRGAQAGRAQGQGAGVADDRP